MPNFIRTLVAVSMAAIMTNIPYLAWADAVLPPMIPTSVVVDEMSGAQALAKVQGFMKREDFRSELVKRGVDPKEVEMRVAALSERELKSLAAQMDQAQYGGDVTGILIVVVLVLLIIFLARRI